MPRTFLGLGGNVGDVAQTFARALGELSREPHRLRVVRTSRLYATAPVGELAGGRFLNAAAEIDTSLPPRELLQVLQSIELSAGRTRDVHWGPRPLDIDILLYGEQIVEEPDLTIPHPALWYRRFVLDPLAEIAADATHPVRVDAAYQRGTIWQIRQRLLIRPFAVQIATNDEPRRERLLVELRRRFPEVEFDAVAWIAPDETVAFLSTSGFVCVPDDYGGLEFLSAVITAATDEPQQCGTLPRR